MKALVVTGRGIWISERRPKEGEPDGMYGKRITLTVEGVCSVDLHGGEAIAIAHNLIDFAANLAARDVDEIILAEFAQEAKGGG